MAYLDSSGLTYLWSKIKAVFATKTEVAAKQDTLVSGTNIKTINSQTILGSGDITFSIDSNGHLIITI